MSNEVFILQNLATPTSFPVELVEGFVPFGRVDGVPQLLKEENYVDGETVVDTL